MLALLALAASSLGISINAIEWRKRFVSTIQSAKEVTRWCNLASADKDIARVYVNFVTGKREYQ